jgi:hypothetical protein
LDADIAQAELAEGARVVVDLDDGLVAHQRAAHRGLVVQRGAEGDNAIAVTQDVEGQGVGQRAAQAEVHRMPREHVLGRHGRHDRRAE